MTHTPIGKTKPTPRRQPAYPTKNCDHCGKPYTPHSKQQRYCDDHKLGRIHRENFAARLSQNTKDWLAGNHEPYDEAVRKRMRCPRR